MQFDCKIYSDNEKLREHQVQRSPTVSVVTFPCPWSCCPHKHSHRVKLKVAFWLEASTPLNTLFCWPTDFSPRSRQGRGLTLALQQKVVDTIGLLTLHRRVDA